MVASAQSSLPSLTALRHGGRRLLAWWLGELASLVPARLRRWWRGTARIVLLSLDGARAVFRRPTDTGLEDLFTVELDPKAAAWSAAAVRQRLAKAAGADYLLLLALPGEQVLQRRLELPAALAENLRQTLRFELDRYTPFRPEQAYFDYRLGNRSADATTLEVELAVLPKPVLEQAQARLATLGLDVGGMVLADDFRNPGYGFRNFLPAAAIAHRPSARRQQRLALAGLAAALLLAVLAIPIWQKRSAAIELLAPLAEARAAARETDALRDTLGKLVEEHDLLPNKKWDSYSATRALEELTRLLPDDTFVMQLDFDGKTVQVLGETASSANMVEAIEASPMFKDVAFKSPLTKIQGTQFDRFHIGATLEGAARPKPEPASGTAAAPSAAPGAAAATTTEKAAP